MLRLLVFLAVLGLESRAIPTPSLLSPYTRFACSDLVKYAGFLEKAKKNPVKDPKTGKIVGMVGELNNHPNCNAAAVNSVRKQRESIVATVNGKKLTGKEYWLQVIEPLYVKHFGHASGVFKEAQKTRDVKALKDLYEKYKNLEWIFVLTLDGGGVRGIIPAKFLAEIESRLKEAKKNGKLTGSTKINEIFHFFGGTSTGGLIALFLNYPDEKRSASQVVDLYKSLSKQIFTSRSGIGGKIRDGVGGVFTSKYSAKNLVQQLKKYVGDVTIKHTLNPVVTISMDANKKEAFLFSTVRALENDEDDYFMWQAGRATSAAPTYFKPYDLTVTEGTKEKVMTLIDGGVGANNPTPLTVDEIYELFNYFDPSPQKKMPYLFIVSLSTGIANEKGVYLSKGALSGGAFSGIFRKNLTLEKIINNFGDTSTRTNDRASASHTIRTGGVYIRITPELGNLDIKLDDGSDENLKKLEDKAEKEINTPENKAKLDKIVQFIMANSQEKMQLAEKWAIEANQTQNKIGKGKIGNTAPMPGR